LSHQRLALSALLVLATADKPMKASRGWYRHCLFGRENGESRGICRTRNRAFWLRPLAQNLLPAQQTLRGERDALRIASPARAFGLTHAITRRPRRRASGRGSHLLRQLFGTKQNAFDNVLDRHTTRRPTLHGLPHPCAKKREPSG